MPILPLRFAPSKKVLSAPAGTSVDTGAPYHIEDPLSESAYVTSDYQYTVSRSFDIVPTQHLVPTRISKAVWAPRHPKYYVVIRGFRVGVFVLSSTAAEYSQGAAKPIVETTRSQIDAIQRFNKALDRGQVSIARPAFPRRYFVTIVVLAILAGIYGFYHAM
ncbi:hypothetical protein CYLTODRAFT_427704 [Cylindrobasidium torrendii FP15055 ss-10]|uniref:Uncharacterized protein n=1 Tax=Cylindrobasidium torrendii FP15055 ss-10 TaxID=1314674 RepID=A0A0D7ARP8_9AGAR|nr:hypothetical protein CYLTODRAFT_427704 [Cylindrobasidium torrendii FP15055 ss-10]